jgi:hypothetical protein
VFSRSPLFPFPDSVPTFLPDGNLSSCVLTVDPNFWLLAANPRISSPVTCDCFAAAGTLSTDRQILILNVISASSPLHMIAAIGYPIYRVEMNPICLHSDRNGAPAAPGHSGNDDHDATPSNLCMQAEMFAAKRTGDLNNEPTKNASCSPNT